MKLVEFRLAMPLTLEEYQLCQLYLVAKASLEDSERSMSEGVPNKGIVILQNESYTREDGAKGQYTYKRMNLLNRLPKWLLSLIDSKYCIVDEKSWNCYPYLKTVYSSSGFPKAQIQVESAHFLGFNTEENALQLSEEQLAIRKVVFVDIVNDKVTTKEYNPKEDPTLFFSEKSGRGRLGPDWKEQSPYIMTCYKLFTINIPYFGFFCSRLENWIVNSLKDNLLRYHRKAFCWMDEWYGLTIEDIRSIEREVQKKLEDFWKQVEGTHEESPPILDPVGTASSVELEHTEEDRNKNINVNGTLNEMDKTNVLLPEEKKRASFSNKKKNSLSSDVCVESLSCDHSFKEEENPITDSTETHKELNQKESVDKIKKLEVVEDAQRGNIAQSEDDIFTNEKKRKKKEEISPSENQKTIAHEKKDKKKSSVKKKEETAVAGESSSTNKEKDVQGYSTSISQEVKSESSKDQVQGRPKKSHSKIEGKDKTEKEMFFFFKRIDNSNEYGAYLHRLSDGVFYSWKHRYFVISGNTLCYYLNDKRGEVRGEMNLRNAQIQWIGEYKGRSNVFVIHTCSKQVVYLSSEDELETKKCMIDVQLGTLLQNGLQVVPEKFERRRSNIEEREEEVAVVENHDDSRSKIIGFEKTELGILDMGEKKYSSSLVNNESLEEQESVKEEVKKENLSEEVSKEKCQKGSNRQPSEKVYEEKKRTKEISLSPNNDSTRSGTNEVIYKSNEVEKSEILKKSSMLHERMQREKTKQKNNLFDVLPSIKKDVLHNSNQWMSGQNVEECKVQEFIFYDITSLLKWLHIKTDSVPINEMKEMSCEMHRLYTFNKEGKNKRIEFFHFIFHTFAMLSCVYSVITLLQYIRFFFCIVISLFCMVYVYMNQTPSNCMNYVYKCSRSLPVNVNSLISFLTSDKSFIAGEYHRQLFVSTKKKNCSYVSSCYKLCFENSWMSKLGEWCKDRKADSNLRVFEISSDVQKKVHIDGKGEDLVGMGSFVIFQCTNNHAKILFDIINNHKEKDVSIISILHSWIGYEKKEDLYQSSSGCTKENSRNEAFYIEVGRMIFSWFLWKVLDLLKRIEHFFFSKYVDIEGFDIYVIHEKESNLCELTYMTSYNYKTFLFNAHLNYSRCLSMQALSTEMISSFIRSEEKEKKQGEKGGMTEIKKNIEDTNSDEQKKLIEEKRIIEQEICKQLIKKIGRAYFNNELFYYMYQIAFKEYTINDRFIKHMSSVEDCFFVMYLCKSFLYIIEHVNLPEINELEKIQRSLKNTEEEMYYVDDLFISNVMVILKSLPMLFYAFTNTFILPKKENQYKYGYSKSILHMHMKNDTPVFFSMKGENEETKNKIQSDLDFSTKSTIDEIQIGLNNSVKIKSEHEYELEILYPSISIQHILKGKRMYSFMDKMVIKDSLYNFVEIRFPLDTNKKNGMFFGLFKRKNRITDVINGNVFNKIILNNEIEENCDTEITMDLLQKEIEPIENESITKIDMEYPRLVHLFHQKHET